MSDMAKNKCFLAIDLGAESGRTVVGAFDGSRLKLSETHRFLNQPVRVHGHLHWDVLRQFLEIKNGLAKSARECGGDLVSLGVDTWGVDFGLLDGQGVSLGNPYHYRDSLTNGMVEEAFRRAPREEIFENTGVQFMQINTLYQLLALALRNSTALKNAATLLMMPDLFTYWLTGSQLGDRTIASTSQCYDPRSDAWAIPLLEKIGLPTHIFPELVSAGTVIGTLLPDVAEECGGDILSVVATGCHDTASAVAAVPALGPNDAYLSSGTWSLMGVEAAGPVINSRSLGYNFTNEGGVCGTIRLLKNITGLWIVQECRRAWEHQGEPLSYDALVQLVQDAAPLTSLIDPDAAIFRVPGDMPGNIRNFCARTGQRVPEGKGAIIRIAMESLALKYRWVSERLEELVGHRLEALRVVGGGIQNKMLNRFTADALRRPVIAGPIEATSAGNILMQMLAFGEISSLREGRELIRDSFETETYQPAATEDWDEAYERFMKLLES
jgi:rhamnulokinase